MLEGLDEVNWESLGCSSVPYLDVTDVPKWIRDLLSANKYVRADARKYIVTVKK